jgi:tetratricopeptide (TPR) repeat protein
MAHVALAEYAAAERVLERSVVLRERALGPDHPLLAEPLSELGFAHFFMGRYEEGRAVLRRAVAVEEKGAGRRLPYWLSNLASVDLALDDTATARANAERAIAIGIRDDGAATVRIDTALMNLAAVLRLDEEFPRAIGLYQQALALTEGAYGADHAVALSGHAALAEAYLASGDPGRAREHLDLSIAGTERAYGRDAAGLADPLRVQGRLLIAQGRPREALVPLERALAIRERVLGRRHADVAEVLADIARARRALGDVPSAERLFRQALAVQRDSLVARHRALVPTLTDLGVLLARGPAREEGLVLVAEGVGIAQAKLAPAHSVRREAEAALGRLRAAAGAQAGTVGR